jgi:hypothetical protein
MFMLLLCLPLLAGMFGIGTVSEEINNTSRTPFPTMTSIEDIAVFPSRVDAYLKENFGFKTLLLNWIALKYFVGLQFATPVVIVGKDKWLFTKSYDAMPKYQGLLCPAPEKLRDQVEKLARLNVASGGKLVFVLAPDKQSVYGDMLPEHLKVRKGNCNIADAYLAALREQGITTLDGRDILGKARLEEKVFNKNDTHWNDRGGSIMYEEVLNVLRSSNGKRNEIEFSREIVMGGDMAGALNGGQLKEENLVLKTQPLGNEYFKPERSDKLYTPSNASEKVSHVLVGNGQHTVLLIGDSYSWLWRKFFLPDFALVAWTDWRWPQIEESVQHIKPDHVVVEIAERLLPI